ncbi:hypothetical protein LXA43DRAFT_635663 [Ganoderma leucocontextum]|nr:hypothetical protein LXA43DRAFT_635663 [Ganoderma leucocontextum]
MNSTNPAPSARPQRADAENRSSVLRASILESALELGVGNSRTVANWIFNAVEEGDEEDNTGIVSPSLTYASTATSASEDSNLSTGRAQQQQQQQQQQQAQPGAGIVIQVNGHASDKDSLHLNLDTSLQHSQRNGLSPARLTPDPTQRTLHLDLRASPEPRAISPAPSSQTGGTKNKLRKPRPDGYESDGGYVSEGGKAKKEKAKKEKEKQKQRKEEEKKEKKSKKKGRDKDGNGGGEGGGVTDYESDGGYLSESSAKRKKSTKEKKQKENDKSKLKSVDSPATDHETDKGYASSFTRSLSRKQSSLTSPVSGDESDGGYLSESSKKRRFFRINSKSRKKQDSLDSMQDQPPPVPALPALPTLPLPIHEKFSRANSPLPRGTSSGIRPSVDTVTSVDTTTSMDTSLTVDTTSTTVESDENRDSPSSTEGLTRAFADAESVRSPSIDLLSAFRRTAADSRPSSPLSPSKFNPFTHGTRPTSPLSPKSHLIPALSPSKSVRARPKISAPNTTTLAPKHVPVPLTITPPTPTSIRHPSIHTPPSPDADYVLVTPNPYTSVVAEPSSPNGAAAAPSSPKLQRPKVLAYYDLPPPSPPPRGPLPDVPRDISRSTSPSWSITESSRLSRSAPADTNDPRNFQQRDVPIHTAVHPLSREIIGSQDVPTIAQPVPPTRRGRVSPFPTAPLLPREQTTPLMRKTSTKTREAVNRALNHNAPASASPYLDGHGRWASHDQVRVDREPVSAQLYPAAGSNWPTTRHVRFAPPRSASAMDTWRPGVDGSSSDDGRPWLAYDDDENGAASDQSLSVPATRAASAEPSPDVNAILAGFRAQRDAELSARKDQRRATKADTLGGIVAGYERETVYLDVEDGGGDRSSVWSEANSRHSFLDSEKSATIREKFVKRVEAMYGKDVVPPMPRLDPGLSSRSG